MRKCIILVLLFFGIFSEEIPEELQEEIEQVFCDTQCLDKIDYTTCSKLSCNCSGFLEENLGNGTWEPGEWHISEPKLLCKDERSIAVQWEAKISLIFLVEMKTNTTTWELKSKTACFRTKIENLESDTDYEIRLWGISKTKTVFGPTNSISIRTHQKNYQPLPVLTFNISTCEVVGSNCAISIEWAPSDDYACFYNFAALPSSWNSWEEPIRRDVRQIDELFHFVEDRFVFGMNYSLELSSVNGHVTSEGKGESREIRTPTCSEAFGNDLGKCVPPPPQNLQTNGKCNRIDFENFICDVEISWTKPVLIPEYYNLNIYNESMLIINSSISGNETSSSLYNLPFQKRYDLVVKAYFKEGISTVERTFWEPNILVFVSDISSASWIKPVSIVFGSACVVLIIICAILYIRYRFNKSENENDADSKYYDDDVKEKYTPSFSNPTTEYYIPEIANDEWQLSSDQVVLDKLLGEGAFGVVHKGFMKTDDGKEIEVAVKMLKGNPSVEEIQQFEHEIEIMKSVGSHPHLVSLVGCCSKIGYLGPFLVVEYCAKGDLQTYLRAVWEQISGQTLDNRYVNSGSFQGDDSKMQNHFSNKIYDMCDDTLLESKDLLSFARQVILGMDYLSNVRVVHRDLATRNVLMCGNRTVKVADFGLSRDVYQDNIYTKKGSGKLPVKWMALESLSHQQYTTQSDVWSFGIVLWEIVTLGGNPYSTVPTGHLLGLLKAGYRMECPKNCSQELYDVMQLCWKEIPKERPTFGDLRKILEKLMENETRYISLDVRF